MVSETWRAIFSWVMLPVYVWQGIAVRLRIERLLPADVATSGLVGAGYAGAPVRLLVLGDSTVASVGMETLGETFAYQVAEAVAVRHRRPVAWRSIGANSATSGALRDHVVPHVEPRDFTHVFVCVGINDMKNFHLVSQFKKTFGTLLYALRTRFNEAEIIWTPIPDMRDCPALPKLLAQVLAARADLINAMGVRLCQERRVTATDPVARVDPSCFARDGFHPNGKGYRVWAEHAAQWIVPRQADPATETQVATESSVTTLPRRA